MYRARYGSCSVSSVSIGTQVSGGMSSIAVGRIAAGMVGICCSRLVGTGVSGSSSMVAGMTDKFCGC